MVVSLCEQLIGVYDSAVLRPATLVGMPLKRIKKS